MKVAIHTVCKNEKENVEPWLQSAKLADHVLMVDTGSTDGTQQHFHAVTMGWKHKFRMKSISLRPWRFDVARNVALALLPDDIDCVITMDMDERLDEGWRDALEAQWRPETTLGFYRYIFAEDENGKPLLEFNQCRMFARHGYTWQLPAHEAPHFYDTSREEVRTVIAGMTMRQRQNHSKVNRMERDLALTKMGFDENPHSQRALFYYARQLHYAGQHDTAINMLNKYFSLGRTFPWEAAAAADCLAASWRALGGTM